MTYTGDKPGDLCSPRTRGWTRGQVIVLILLDLLPVHAGMDPFSRSGFGLR